MRLKEIKISGFKTFVEPTRVRTTHHLVGIVGPNGCGKSNLVEAVSWAMGELSTRRLRAESLADVIFNGSASRKPVGQASVELILENSTDGPGTSALEGRFATLRETSVRRILDRDGNSGYFLNGVACRRRDVQGLFLGTGVTPGSYAIIGQGMISRLVEAGPEELRLFLEDAAGVSRYRQQRRETHSRMRNTEENISIISNIRKEVKVQLNKLEEQARTAQRFLELQKELRTLEVSLLAGEWDRGQQELEEQRLVEARGETDLERLKAALSELEQRLREQQAERERQNERYNSAQADFYETGAGISDLEQQVNFMGRRLEEQRVELARGSEEDQRLRESLEQERRAAQALRETLRQRAPELEAARRVEADAERQLRGLEEKWRESQEAWEKSLEAVALQAQESETVRARLESLEAAGAEAREHGDTLRRESVDSGADPFERRVVSSRETWRVAERGQRKLEQELARRRGELQDCREQVAEMEKRLEQQRTILGDLEARFHPLDALQEAALGRRDGHAASEAWLRKQKLNGGARLGECLRVEEGWERAVEMVLGRHLQDLIVADPAIFHTVLAELEEGFVGLCRVVSAAAPVTGSLLYARLREPRPPPQLLEGIYSADGLEDAQALLDQLEPGQSVVTRDGIWLGHGWVRVARGTADGLSGLLEREGERQQLRLACEESRSELEKLGERYRALRQRGTTLEKQIDGLQEQFHQAQQETAKRLSDFSAVQAEQRQFIEGQDRLERQLAELGERQSRWQEEEVQLQRRLVAGQEKGKDLAQRRQRFAENKEQCAGKLEAVRACWRESSSENHRIGLQVRELRSRLEGLEHGVQREQEQLERWRERYGQLRKTLRGDEERKPELQRRLQEVLQERGRRKQVLAEHRQRLEELNAAGRVLEQEKSQQERACRESGESLNQQRLVLGERRARLQGIEQGLQRLEIALEVLHKVARSGDAQKGERRLERLRRRLERMGAVNPTAVEEATQLRERCGYLDSQLRDLEQALDNLRQAMRKIDRESRLRFEQTFQRVSEKLGERFRRLFDGGGAKLQLSGEDPMQAGVVLLAHPPGKHNRNMQQLSGGEKALAALALVFAIFELNPAPFCILDEVDAPLDDINVDRFLALLRELSPKVQFLLVTHNKISMEAVDTLLGVTMPEVGVSQVISIAVEEATRMVAAG